MHHHRHTTHLKNMYSLPNPPPGLNSHSLSSLRALNQNHYGKNDLYGVSRKVHYVWQREWAFGWA